MEKRKRKNNEYGCNFSCKEKLDGRSREDPYQTVIRHWPTWSLPSANPTSIHSRTTTVCRQHSKLLNHITKHI